MINSDAVEIASVIRRHIDAEDVGGGSGTVRSALTEIAEVVGDLHAATNRMPATAKKSFMAACGLRKEEAPA